MAKLFKARYYKNTSFLDANLGHNPSFIWQGVWKARTILEKGCRWRTGDGHTINIWKDPRIRIPNNFRLITPAAAPFMHVRIVIPDLWIHGSKEWDVELLAEIFQRTDAQAIANIPLSRSNKLDSLIWQFDKKGTFSVKAG